MTDYVFQGIATAFDKCFPHGDRVLILKARCFDRSISSGEPVSLLNEHDETKSFGRADRLELYAGNNGLAFRFHIGDHSEFKDIADDFDSYIPISIGYESTKTDTTVIDGVEVVSVIEAKLVEVSALSKSPAVHSTYGRVVSLESCGTLAEDYESGRLELVGKYIGIHRTFKASENGGVLKYSHATSPYERAAANFEQALKNLEYS
jgi:HK97 family phage prohead protease